jgi:hypothetical protein
MTDIFDPLWKIVERFGWIAGIVAVLLTILNVAYPGLLSREINKAIFWVLIAILGFWFFVTLSSLTRGNVPPPPETKTSAQTVTSAIPNLTKEDVKNLVQTKWGQTKKEIQNLPFDDNARGDKLEKLAKIATGNFQVTWGKSLKKLNDKHYFRQKDFRVYKVTEESSSTNTKVYNVNMSDSFDEIKIDNSGKKITSPGEETCIIYEFTFKLENSDWKISDRNKKGTC